MISNTRRRSTAEKPNGPPSGGAIQPSAFRSGLRRQQVVQALRGQLGSMPALIGLLVLMAFFATQSDVFLSGRNLSNLLIQTVVTGIIAAGLVFVLLVGEIDLAVAATSGLCGVVMARLVVQAAWPSYAAVLAAIVAGALIGLIQGNVITRLGVPSFVVTLGVSLILNAGQLTLLPQAGQINLLGTDIPAIAGAYVAGWLAWLGLILAVVGRGLFDYQRYYLKRTLGLSPRFDREVALPAGLVAVFGAGLVWVLDSQLGIPTPVLLFTILLIGLSYVANETRFGRYLYAIGGNREAARRAGIPVETIVVGAFTLAGAMAALGGVVAASRILGVSVQSGGGTLLLETIAAAVIGGTSLFGGRGRVVAALLGALVIGTVSNGLNLMGAGTAVKLAVTGLLLVIAVAVDRGLESASAVRETAA